MNEREFMSDDEYIEMLLAERTELKEEIEELKERIEDLEDKIDNLEGELNKYFLSVEEAYNVLSRVL